MPQLITTPGDGGLSVNVSSSGYFSGASYDPIGPGTAARTTFLSDVAFRINPAGTNESNGSNGPRSYIGGLASNATSSDTSATSTTSSFQLSGLQFELVQSVSNLVRNGTRIGSGLSQIYQITNTTNTAIDFELVRYFDGDLSFDGSIADRGGRIVRNGIDILFETDNGDNPAAPTTFVGITANGGTPISSNRLEIGRFGDINSSVASGAPLSGVILGDTNGDSFIDSAAYDLAPALRNIFTLAPGETTNYVTETLFGTGLPTEIVLPETITVVASDANAFEDSGNTATFTLTRANDNPNKSITVNFRISGSATNGIDYNTLGSSVTFAPGETTKTVTIVPKVDGIIEETESVVLTLVNGTGYNLDLRGKQARVTIADDINSAPDTQPIVSINNVSFSEGNSGTSRKTFTISLNKASDIDLTVDYATVDGTAKAGTDYTAISKRTLVFAAGEVSKQINVDIVSDLEIEPDEAFKVVLSDPTNVTIAATAFGTATIVNDDFPISATVTEKNLLKIQGGNEVNSFLKFTKSSQQSTEKSEILAFVVDDDLGGITTSNGTIQAGTPGYLKAALDRAQVVFSTLSTSNFDMGVTSDAQRYLNFFSGQRIEFLRITNDTIDGVKADLAANRPTANVLFSLTEANPIGAPTTKFTATPGKNGYDIAFTDLVLKVEALDDPERPIGTGLQGKAEGQVIDLRSISSFAQSVVVVSAKSDATYQNRIGFYAVEDDKGTIIDDFNNTLKPGDAGYIEAAIAAAVRTLTIQPVTTNFNFLDTLVVPNKILAPILITNSTFENYLNVNPGNAKTDGNVHAYVNYIQGNIDKVDHFRQLGDNKFGVEDIFGGGDRDFNDVVIQLTVR
jgi:Calx-beta domain/Domain of unknown function (DUF4114)